jgi:hypothetical protein
MNSDKGKNRTVDTDSPQFRELADTTIMLCREWRPTAEPQVFDEDGLRVELSLIKGLTLEFGGYRVAISTAEVQLLSLTPKKWRKDKETAETVARIIAAGMTRRDGHSAFPE